MRLNNTIISAALITLMTAATATHASAGDLVSGVSNTLGGGGGGGGGGLASAHVNANVGGLNAKADAKVGSSTSVTASVGTTRTSKVVDADVKANLGTAKGGLSAKARADIAHTIQVRASVLSNKRLLALCINVGATGCGHASRSHQLALIKAKVNGLSGQRLVTACVAIGGGCGARLASGGGNGGGGNGGGNGGGSGGNGGGSGNGHGSGPLLASAGNDKDRDVILTCRTVLSNPVRYERGMVKLCRQMAQ